MLTKGIIKSIDFTGNTCIVRMPLFENSNEGEELTTTATISALPGAYNGFKEGDVVIVGFENNKIDQAIVLGKLFLGTKDSEAEGRGSINCSSLTVEESATIPLNTKLTFDRADNSYVSVQGNYDSYKTLTDIVDALQVQEKAIGSTRAQIIDDGEKLGMRMSKVEDLNNYQESRFEIDEASIRAKVNKESNGESDGFGWELLNDGWKVEQDLEKATAAKQLDLVSWVTDTTGKMYYTINGINSEIEKQDGDTLEGLMASADKAVYKLGLKRKASTATIYLTTSVPFNNFQKTILTVDKTGLTIQGEVKADTGYIGDFDISTGSLVSNAAIDTEIKNTLGAGFNFKAQSVSNSYTYAIDTFSKLYIKGEGDFSIVQTGQLRSKAMVLPANLWEQYYVMVKSIRIGLKDSKRVSCTIPLTYIWPMQFNSTDKLIYSNTATITQSGSSMYTFGAGFAVTSITIQATYLIKVSSASVQADLIAAIKSNVTLTDDDKTILTNNGYTSYPTYCVPGYITNSSIGDILSTTTYIFADTWTDTTSLTVGWAHTTTPTDIKTQESNKNIATLGNILPESDASTLGDGINPWGSINSKRIFSEYLESPAILGHGFIASQNNRRLVGTWKADNLSLGELTVDRINCSSVSASEVTYNSNMSINSSNTLSLLGASAQVCATNYVNICGDSNIRFYAASSQEDKWLSCSINHTGIHLHNTANDSGTQFASMLELPEEGYIKANDIKSPAGTGASSGYTGALYLMTILPGDSWASGYRAINLSTFIKKMLQNHIGIDTTKWTETTLLSYGVTPTGREDTIFKDYIQTHKV